MTFRPFHQIRQNNFLSLTDLIELRRVSTLSIPVKVYKRNEFIYQTGDLAKRIFVIQQGRIKVGSNTEDSKEMIKGIYERGDFFGESALIDQVRRLDFAQAMEETKVYDLTIEKLGLLMEENHEMIKAIMRTIGERLLDRELRLQAMIDKSSRTRIVEFLISLAQKKGQRVGYEIVVRKFMTHKEIAGLTDTSRQTVTTVLNELRNNKVLTFNRRRLLIRSMDLLRAESLQP